MRFRHVAKIVSTDGSDPLYFIDGEKYDDIYTDEQLLHRLLGKSFQHIFLTETDPFDFDKIDVVSSIRNIDDLDELLALLRENPDLVE